MAAWEAGLTERVDLKGGDARLKELVIYIAQQCDADPAFGAVKLNKILFHSDFRAYKMRRKPITGTPYFRLKHGPAPRAMVPCMEELHRHNEVVTQKKFVGGRLQKRPIALRPANLDQFFDASDIAIVNEVIREQWGQSATAVSNESHTIQWKTRADKDPIPYEAAFLSDEPVTHDDRLRARELIAELGIGPP